jgi:hypothetical protein
MILPLIPWKMKQVVPGSLCRANTLHVRQLFLARTTEYYGTDLSPPAKLFRPKSYDNEWITRGKMTFFEKQCFWKKYPDSGPLCILVYLLRYIFSFWHIVIFYRGGWKWLFLKNNVFEKNTQIRVPYVSLCICSGIFFRFDI